MVRRRRIERFSKHGPLASGKFIEDALESCTRALRGLGVSVHISIPRLSRVRCSTQPSVGIRTTVVDQRF